MVDFLVDQGIELERGSKFWPDYYDELPGGCKTSRTVVAKPFDKKQLGEWEDKLRPGFLPMKITLDDGLKLPFAAKSWKIKALFAKVALGMVAAKLRGQHWVTAGAALQGRMLQASLKAGVEIRTDAPVNELIVEDGAVTGVVTTQDGKPWRIGANLGVLVNAGGFGKNQAMRDRYMPGTRPSGRPGTRGRHRRPARRDGAHRRRAGADGPDGRLPDDARAGLGAGLCQAPGAGRRPASRTRSSSTSRACAT